MAPENGGEGGGSGGGEGGGSGNGGADDAAVQARIQQEVEKAVSGLKSKNSELLGKLKERDEQIKKFDGIDPDAVRNILKRFADDEEAKLIADGKIDEVLNKRTERMRGDFEKKLTDAQKQAQEAVERAKSYEGKVLENSLMAAAAKVGVHQHAIEDVLFRGRAMFALDSNGQAVMLDDENKPVLGKDGKTPFSPGEWLEGMKEKAPHWFPATASGGGAGGGGGGGGGGTKGNFGGSKEERQAAIAAKYPNLKSA